MGSMLRGTDTSGDISMGVGLVVCTVLSVVCIIQPLLSMARQAQAWVNLTNSFKTDARQRVSALLSPKCDRFELLNHYNQMQDHFTWTVTGMKMLISSIVAAITSYFAVMWATIFLPAIQDYADQLQRDLENELNQTGSVIV